MEKILIFEKKIFDLKKFFGKKVSKRSGAHSGALGESIKVSRDGTRHSKQFPCRNNAFSRNVPDTRFFPRPVPYY